MLVIGIDPGLSGGIAALAGENAWCWPMPCVERPTGRKTKKGNPKIARAIDREKLVSVIETATGNHPFGRTSVAWVERAQSAPGMSAPSVFNYGLGYGAVLGVLASFGLDVREVRPAIWMRDLGLVTKGNRKLGAKDARRKSGGKKKSLELARQLFPQLAEQLKRQKDEGLAEALLIASWGREQIAAEMMRRTA